MKDNLAEQVRKNNVWLADHGVVDNIKLRGKYTVHFTPKFGGKKRSQSNSGLVGRAHRRRTRGKR